MHPFTCRDFWSKNYKLVKHINPMLTFALRAAPETSPYMVVEFGASLRGTGEGRYSQTRMIRACFDLRRFWPLIVTRPLFVLPSCFPHIADYGYKVKVPIGGMTEEQVEKKVRAR